MVSDTPLRLAVCVAQGSLESDTLLRFVTLGDSESPVNRYTSVLRPLGLLNAPVMRYTSCVSCPSVLYHAHPCALCPIGRNEDVRCDTHCVPAPLGGPSSFHVRCDTRWVYRPFGRTSVVPCPVRYTVGVPAIKAD